MSISSDQSYSVPENTIVYLVSFCPQGKQHKQRRNWRIMHINNFNFNSMQNFWNKQSN